MARIRIFEKSGGEVAEFTATAVRSWKLNGQGKAVFELATLDAAARYDVLRYGNMVVIGGHAQLPIWCGVIDPEREWATAGVRVTAYTGEHLFTWRTEPDGATLKGTPGSLFKQLIVLANGFEDLGIRFGTIWEGGQERQETIGPGSYLEDLQRIAERAKNDFTVEGVIDEVTRRLSWRANWFERVGETVDALVLEEGVNLELSGKPLSEQGEIANVVFGRGDGATDAARPKTMQTSEGSLKEFRLRQKTVNFSGVTQRGTLEANTKEAVKTLAYPRRTFAPVALDVGNTFGALRGGNRMGLLYHSVGFHQEEDGSMAVGTRAWVRLLGMEYDDVRKMKLVCDEEEQP